MHRPAPHLKTNRAAAPLLGLFLWMAPHGMRAADSGEAAREVANQSLRPNLHAGTERVFLRSEAASDGQPSSQGSEFGEQVILRRRAHVEPWTATLETSLSFTDNAALTPRGAQKDWYLRLGASIAYTNRVKGPVFLDLSLQHYLFRYAEFETLDFDHTRLGAGFLVQAPWLGDALLSARYGFQRIAEPFGAQLFDRHAIVLGAQKIWQASLGQQVVAGLSADLALASDPAAGERDEYSLFFGYEARLTRRFSTRLSYRLGAYHYGEGSRQDWNQILVLGANFEAASWLRVSTTASLSRNDSNRAFAEYQNFAAEFGLSVYLTF